VNIKSALHITNGDCAGDLIQKSLGLDSILVWRDVLEDGPCPRAGSLREFSEARAKFLSERGWLSRDEIRKSFDERQLQLETHGEHSSILLWFEHDLHDQLHILQCLDWLSSQKQRDTPVELISINQFAGIVPFRGIGQLTVEQIRQLIRHRTQVTEHMLAIASAGWSAFCSADPRKIHEFIQRDDLFAYQRDALSRHLQEFPWLGSGLNRTEQQVLELIANGSNTPFELFGDNMNREQWLFYGDWSFWVVLERMSTGNNPLISIDDGSPFIPELYMKSIVKLKTTHLTLTEYGKAGLAGNCDWIRDSGHRSWRGGVELGPGCPDWRWDPQSQCVRMM
jgi:hypothetical protein